MAIQHTRIDIEQPFLDPAVIARQQNLSNDSLADDNGTILPSLLIQSQAIYRRLLTKKPTSRKSNDAVIRFPGNLELTIELDVGMLSPNALAIANSTYLN